MGENTPLNTFEIVTILTVGSIGAIILLYFVVLKRKGWLTEESRSETSYLCSNPQCRKVFQEPIKLTDLSQSPPRVYLGCPHCGIDMEKIPAATSEKIKTEDQNIPQSKHIIHEIPHLESAAMNLLDVKSTPSQNPPSSTSPPQTSLQPKQPPKPPPFQTLPRTHENAQKPEDKKQSAGLKACQHYLGYVRTLPKSTPIPDECMWCSLIVKCLTGAEKIEA